MAETPSSRVSYDFVTRAIARTLGNPGKGYFALLAAAVALLGVGIVCLLFLLRYGLGTLRASLGYRLRPRPLARLYRDAGRGRQGERERGAASGCGIGAEGPAV